MTDWDLAQPAWAGILAKVDALKDQLTRVADALDRSLAHVERLSSEVARLTTIDAQRDRKKSETQWFLYVIGGMWVLLLGAGGALYHVHQSQIDENRKHWEDIARSRDERTGELIGIREAQRVLIESQKIHDRRLDTLEGHRR